MEQSTDQPEDDSRKGFPKQVELMKARNIPVYVRSHSDSFSESWAIPDSQPKRKSSKRTQSKHAKKTVSVVDDVEAEPQASVKYNIPRSSKSEPFVEIREISESSRESCAEPLESSRESCAESLESRKCWGSLFSNLEPKASWVLLFCSIIPINILFGINIIGFGIYYVEYVEYFNVSRSTVGIIAAVKIGVVSVFGIFASSLLKRYSTRRMAMCGGTILTVAVLLNSFAPNVYVLYCTQGILEGIGGSLLVMTTSVLTQQHFHRNRALGGGLGMLGYSIGHLLGPPLLNLLIQTYGWRGSAFITTALYGNIFALGATLWHPADRRSAKPTPIPKNHTGHNDSNGVKYAPGCREESPSASTETAPAKNTNPKAINGCKDFCKDIFDFSYFLNPKFMLVCVGGAMARYELATFLEQGPSKSVAMGMSRAQAAFILSTASMVNIVARVMTTFVANFKCVNRVFYYTWGVIFGSAGAFLTLVHTFEGQVMSAVLHGLQMAFTNTIQSVIIVDLMGLENLPKCAALNNLIVCAASMFASPIGGHIYDVTESYDIPFIVSGSMCFMGAMMTLGVGAVYEVERRRPRNLRDKSPETSVVDMESQESLPKNETK